MISLARGERKRNKNNTSPAFCQGWGAIKGASEGPFFFYPKTSNIQKIKIKNKKASLCLASSAFEGAQGHKQEKQWSMAGASHSPELATLLCSLGVHGGLPSMTHKPSPSAAHWAPSKGKAHRRHHPWLSSQVLGKSSHSEEVTWAVDLKIKREKDWACWREKPQPTWGFRTARFWLKSTVLILDVSFHFTSWDPFPTFVLSTSREVSLGHVLTPAVFLQWDNGASTLLKCRHYREITTELQLFFQNICFASAHRVILGIVH